MLAASVRVFSSCWECMGLSAQARRDQIIKHSASRSNTRAVALDLDEVAPRMHRHPKSLADELEVALSGPEDCGTFGAVRDRDRYFHVVLAS